MAASSITLRINNTRRVFRRLRSAFGFVFMLVILQTAWADSVDEPDGYRLERYDDVVPVTLRGATRVTALDVARLKSEHDALIVDVIPEHIKPADLPADQQWFPVPHVGVAGAVWLPDVGFGSLSETTEKYFSQHLSEYTGGDSDYPVVFYCRSDCWMSWNAAKRALALGYTRVYWFADGINDWEFEGFDTEILQPAPGVRH